MEKHKVVHKLLLWGKLCNLACSAFLAYLYVRKSFNKDTFFVSDTFQFPVFTNKAISVSRFH